MRYFPPQLTSLEGLGEYRTSPVGSGQSSGRERKQFLCTFIRKPAFGELNFIKRC